MRTSLLGVTLALALGLAAGPAPAPLAAAPQAGAAAAAPQPRSGRLVLGMLRNDGILLPFAAFDGRDWSTPWPGVVPRGRGAVSRDLPASVADVPRDWWGGEAPGEWRLVGRDDAPRKPFTLVSPTMFLVGDVRQLGLRTSHPPAAPPVPLAEVPYPKLGLGVAGDAELRQIATVSSKTVAWREFAASLRAEFDAAEERAVRGLSSNAAWRHPFDRAARQRLAPELEAWYVTELSESGQRVSYVEAAKKYPVLPADDGCGLETFVSGWVHHDGKSPRPKTTLKATVTYCDRDRVSYMLPFAQTRLRDRLHWIFQMSGRDHEWYVVTELTPGRTRYVAEYQAGGFVR